MNTAILFGGFALFIRRNQIANIEDCKVNHTFVHIFKLDTVPMIYKVFKSKNYVLICMSCIYHGIFEALWSISYVLNTVLAFF